MTVANSPGREKWPCLSGGVRAHPGGTAPLPANARASCPGEQHSGWKGGSDLWSRVAWKSNAGPFVGGVLVPLLGGIPESYIHELG